MEEYVEQVDKILVWRKAGSFPSATEVTVLPPLVSSPQYPILNGLICTSYNTVLLFDIHNPFDHGNF